jgi:hypothetical protein
VSSEDFIEALHDDLMSAARRTDESAAATPPPTSPRGDQPRQRRWQRGRIAVAAALVTATAVGVFVVAQPTTVSAEIEVIRQGDELIIRLTDVENRPEEIEQAARDAGIDVSVVEVPVGPSNVGRFAGASTSGGTGDLYVVDGDRASGFSGFRVPADYDGQVQLMLGRPAKPGETWRVGSISTARGEPLECADVEGRSVGDVVELARDRGVNDIRVSVVDDPDGPGLHDEDLERYADASVARVLNLDADSVTIEAAWDLASLPPATHRDAPPCEGSDGG